MCVISAATLMLGCGAPAHPDLAAGTLVEESCPSPSAEDYYFSFGSLAPTPTGDAAFRRAYSELLRQATVLPLWCDRGPLEAYRLVWLPTYGQALVVSASRSVDGWAIQGVEYAKRDPRQIRGWRAARRVERPLRSDEINQVSAALDRGRFWVRPFFEESGTTDGVLDTIEGRIDGRYRVVTRASVRSNDLDEAMRKLIELAGLRTPDELRDPR